VPRKYVVLLALSLGVVAADQLVKYRLLGELTSAFDAHETFSGRLGVFLSEAPEAGFDGLHFRHKKSITLVEDHLKLRYAENPGAAFGLFRKLPEQYRAPLFHIVSLGAVVLIAWYFRQLKGAPDEKWAYFGLPLVLGGAVGNYIDRIARGFVIDFLEAHWKHDPGLTWPSFNVADSAIVVGVGMLMVDAWVRKEEKSPAPAVAAPEGASAKS
jgi:signal peptidase II